MKAKKCVLTWYTYSGVIISEMRFNSLSKALGIAKIYRPLNGYCYVIYDAETMGILREGKA